MRPVELPRFVPRAPWLGPDLQTVRNYVRGPATAPGAGARERLALPLSDGSGDRLSAMLERPAREEGRPLVVLIHGLSGSEESVYVVASAAHWLRAGHPVLRLNLRGAGPSRPLCRLQYHAGRSEDLRDALEALEPVWSSRGLVLVGYSLGGNMLLKFLAEHGPRFPVHAAGSVSAPIDLGAASLRFLDPRNRPYHRRLLHFMKRESLAAGAALSAGERRAIRAARSALEFDETFVAPRNGYGSAWEYYETNAAVGFLARIRVPTLVIHALDDPWIPADAYTRFPWDAHPALRALLPPGGGHLGFHGQGSRVPWHDRCLARFVAAQAPGR